MDNSEPLRTDQDLLGPLQTTQDWLWPFRMSLEHSGQLRITHDCSGPLRTTQDYSRLFWIAQDDSVSFRITQDNSGILQDHSVQFMTSKDCLGPEKSWAWSSSEWSCPEMSWNSWVVLNGHETSWEVLSHPEWFWVVMYSFKSSWTVFSGPGWSWVVSMCSWVVLSGSEWFLPVLRGSARGLKQSSVVLSLESSWMDLSSCKESSELLSGPGWNWAVLKGSWADLSVPDWSWP